MAVAPESAAREDARILATTDLIMVVLFGGLAAMVLLPTRREKLRIDTTSS